MTNKSPSPQEEPITTCGDCGEWKSRHNIILCGACYSVMKDGFIAEGRKQVLKDELAFLRELRKKVKLSMEWWLRFDGRIEKIKAELSKLDKPLMYTKGQGDWYPNEKVDNHSSHDVINDLTDVKPNHANSLRGKVGK